MAPFLTLLALEIRIVPGTLHVHHDYAECYILSPQNTQKHVVLGPGAEFLRFSTNWGD